MRIKLKKIVPSKVITDLKNLVESSAEYFGEKDLYIYKENKSPSAEEKHFSYNDSLKYMNQLGTAFNEIGLMGKHIAVIGDSHPYYLTTYYATVNGGGVIIPLDKELNDTEIVNFLNISGAVAVVYTEAFNNRLINSSDKLPNVQYFIPIHDYTEDLTHEKVKPLGELLKSGEQALANGNKNFINHSVDTEKMCAIIFTSGTTGTSKGVMLSQKNLTANTNSACIEVPYDYRNTFVSLLPMSHTYEMTCGNFAISNLGGTIYINDSLKNALRSFSVFKPNALMLVPLFVETMHKKIWSEIGKKGMTNKVRAAMKVSDGLLAVGIDLREKFFSQITNAFGGNLKSIICGGAALNTLLIKDFASFGIQLFEGYGITECAPLVAVNTPECFRFKSVGRPVIGCEVKIEKQPDEEMGEICVKGDNVMLGYYNNDEATKAAFTDDGWFKTGDIGYIDSDGYIFITGRKKNVIILSNGKNIYPEEIEEYLGHVESIEESVVVERKNSNGESVLTAVIYPNYDVVVRGSKDEIYAVFKEEINTVNKNLPVYKQIREIEVRDAEFEKTTSKKIKRYKV
jgi:long-chain acyl-CoA synthetase